MFSMIKGWIAVRVNKVSCGPLNISAFSGVIIIQQWLYRQENPILESSDEDFAFAEEETFSQNKYLDIFTFFAFLNDPVQLAAKLRYYNILKSTVRCSGSGCRREMKAEKTADVSDGYVWRCGFCRKKKSIRATSYFEQSKLPLKKLYY